MNLINLIKRGFEQSVGVAMSCDIAALSRKNQVAKTANL